jgi:hypothetical protein
MEGNSDELGAVPTIGKMLIGASGRAVAVCSGPRATVS